MIMEEVDVLKSDRWRRGRQTPSWKLCDAGHKIRGQRQTEGAVDSHKILYDVG
jgi:hypothetical protein